MAEKSKALYGLLPPFSFSSYGLSSAHNWGLTGLQAHTSSYYFTSHKQNQELAFKTM